VVTKISEKLKRKALDELVKETNQTSTLSIYLDLFKILENTKFKVWGNRSRVRKTPSTKTMPIIQEKMKEKKEKGPGR